MAESVVDGWYSPHAHDVPAGSVLSAAKVRVQTTSTATQFPASALTITLTWSNSPVSGGFVALPGASLNTGTSNGTRSLETPWRYAADGLYGVAPHSRMFLNTTSSFTSSTSWSHSNYSRRTTLEYFPSVLTQPYSSPF